MLRTAVFTMARDERVFLPIWLRYYSQFFSPEDIYVYNHRTTDGSIEAARREWKFRPIDVDHPAFNDFPWYTAFVQERQRKLLRRYDVVLFAEPDEILWVAGGLDRYIGSFRRKTVRARGFTIWHDRSEEPPLDLSRTVLSQRRYCALDPDYCKPLLTRVPLVYAHGFHRAVQAGEIDENLYLFHLHCMDYGLALEKHERNRSYRDYSRQSVEQGMGFQGLLIGEDFIQWFEGRAADSSKQLIPDHVRWSDNF